MFLGSFKNDSNIPFIVENKHIRSTNEGKLLRITIDHKLMRITIDNNLCYKARERQRQRQREIEREIAFRRKTKFLSQEQTKDLSVPYI